MTKNIFFAITILAVSLLLTSGCEESSLSPSAEPAALQSAPAKAPVVKAAPAAVAPAPVVKPKPALAAKPVSAPVDKIPESYRQRAAEEIAEENMEAELKKIEKQIEQEISAGL